MADPFGIAGLVGVALQIFQLSVQLGLAWKDAPAVVRSFYEELQALKTVLSETTMNLQLRPELADAFQGKHSALLSQLNSADMTNTQLLLKTCEEELKQLLKELQKRAQGRRLGWERAKSAFTSNNTREAVENLRRRCDLINSLVSLDALALGASTYTELTEFREEQRQNHEAGLRAVSEVQNQLGDVQEMQLDQAEASLRQVVLEWLSPFDYAAEQHDHISRRQPGSGRWLLESEEYQSWLSTKGRALLCPGIPGAGKTILASIAIENVRETFEDDPAVTVLQIYCNFNRKDEQRSDDLLLSLLRQLSANCHALPASVRSLYKKHERKSTRPTSQEISQVLRLVSSSFNQVFVFVDALDECQMVGGHRDSFIRELLALQESAPVNLFLTSRYIPGVFDKFKSSTTVEVRANVEDVRAYVKGYIPRLPNFVSRKPELQEEIVDKISNAVKGMFLLAKLYMDSLVGSSSPKALRATLNRIVTGSGLYDEAYTDAMVRIRGQLPSHRQLAEQVLSWVVCAMRQLTVAELREALAIEEGEPRLDPDNMADIEDLVSVCAGLVTVDEESQVIRLVHYTTQEFFQRTQVQWFPDVHLQIMAACLTYLCFENFEGGVLKERADYLQRLRDNALYEYVCAYWGFHARMARLPKRPSREFPLLELLRFFSMEGHRSAASQVLFKTQKIRTPWGIAYHRTIPTDVSGLHLAAYFGLNEIVEHLLRDCDPDVADTFGRGPLYYAAEGGHTGCVKLLMDRIPRERWIGKGDGTPLHATVRFNRVETAKYLLDSGFPIEAVDGRGQVALHLAAWDGLLELCALFLNRGTPVDTKDREGKTPLQMAAHHGMADCCQLLLDYGADVNHVSKWDTPLYRAADSGVLKAVELLLERGATVDAWSSHGTTPLHAAAFNPDGRALDLLLKAGADVDAKETVRGCTPLILAAEHSLAEGVRVLLKHGANACERDVSGRSALFHAAHRGHFTIVELLVDHFGDALEALDDADAYGSTPLSIATRHDYQEIMELLLKTHAVDINARDRLGRSVTSWVRNEETRKILMDEAERRRVVVEFNEPLRDIDINPAECRWRCDVCTMGAPEKRYHCRKCFADDFDICEDCWGLGARCLDDDHVLEEVEETVNVV